MSSPRAGSTSGSSRGRGRGRGVSSYSPSPLGVSASASASVDDDQDSRGADPRSRRPVNGSSNDIDDDVTMAEASTSTLQPPPTSATAGSPQRQAPSSTSSRGTLLGRGSSYTGGTKMKFRPNFVARKVKVEEGVKEEEVEPSLAHPGDSSRNFHHGSGANARGRGGMRGARGGARGASDDHRGGGRGGSPAGRGRGRGNDIVMTASGAFALGPHVAERDPGSRKSRVFGDAVMTLREPPGGSGSGSGGFGGLGGGGPKTSSTVALVASDSESDDGRVNGEDKVDILDLFDIGREDEMAPLVLPRDEKKWKEEEKLREENERARKRFGGGDGSRKGKGRGKLEDAAEGGGPEDSNNAASADTPKSKMDVDPYDEEERIAASLQGTPQGSAPATPTTAHPPTDHAGIVVADAGLTSAQEAVTLGIEDVQIKVKKENVADYFHFQGEEARQERFYVFQFPRVFPRFFDPADPLQTKHDPREQPDVQVKTEDTAAQDKKPSPSKLNHALAKGSAAAGSNAAVAFSSSGGSKASQGGNEEKPLLQNPYATVSKHRVKSALHESESDSWRDYEPGKWQGWGRNSGTGARDAMAGNGRAEGRIGKLRIRRSGKVTLRLGSGPDKVDYEILPGAPAAFLQELAVLSPGVTKNVEQDPQDDPSNIDSSSKQGGIYVMGQLSKKFVIAPDLTQLLRMDANEKKVQYQAWKKQQQELNLAAAKAKLEEMDASTTPSTSSGVKQRVAAGGAGGAPGQARGRGTGSTAGTIKRTPSTTAGASGKKANAAPPSGRGRGRPPGDPSKASSGSAPASAAPKKASTAS